MYKLFKLTNTKNAELFINITENIFECYNNDINMNFIYSTNLSTINIINLTLKNNKLRMSKKTISNLKNQFVKGDGTVTENSLKAFKSCQKNLKNKNSIISTSKFENLNHLDVLKDSKVISKIIHFIKKIEH